MTASVAATGDAHAFCRTTTCGLPPGFSPEGDQCEPDDFAQRCASLDPPVKILPVYWSNACISYDIQKNASQQVPYATADTLFAAAFAKWTGTACGATDDSAAGHVSIAVTDLGPVDCDQVQYSSDQGNQHVIIFHDDVWPHDDSSNTLGLTTITFDPDTGEIYDADMEINSTPGVPLSLGATVPSGGYDFQSIIQHETGHFLGMAHSGDVQATMFAHYMPGTMTMRQLTLDDMDGICSIYHPDGARSVDPSVSSSGTLPEAACDPTPRHGFQSECAQPQHAGCAIAASSDAAEFPGSAIAAVALLAGVRVRRRRHRA
jgi:MYXO-CTERM domain-containing protein